jgi:hypothetical protein
MNKMPRNLLATILLLAPATVLAGTEQSNFLGGTCPADAAADLIDFYPLQTSNATQANEGLDAGGDLIVTGATFVSSGGPGPTTCGGAVPTFTVSPTATAAANGHQIQGTITCTGTCTVYAVAVNPGDGLSASACAVAVVADAPWRIGNVGLTIGSVVWSADAAGTVISQNPSPSTEIAPFDAITITLAQACRPGKRRIGVGVGVNR